VVARLLDHDVVAVNEEYKAVIFGDPA